MEDTNDKISSEKQQEEKKRNNPVFSIKELDIDEDLEELDMRERYQTFWGENYGKEKDCIWRIKQKFTGI